MFVSGLPICDGFTDDEKHAPLRLEPGQERYEPIERVICGQTVCSICGISWLYSRKPTRDEIQSAQGVLFP